MMGVAVIVEVDEGGICQEARLVYLNAGDGPVFAETAADMLRGERLSEEAFSAAASEAADKAIDPMGNVHATIGFQRHLARVLTKRALTTALSRVGDSKA